jgi:hypothetical protein
MFYEIWKDQNISVSSPPDKIQNWIMNLKEAIPFLLCLWFDIFSSIYLKINKALLISS